VVGLDGSLSSREALRWAAHMVRLTGEHIVAVHALGTDEPLVDDLADRRSQTEISEVMELEWCRELVRSRIPFSAVVRRGEPVDVISAAAEQHRAGLVVVGNRGAGTAPTLGMGQTSRQMLRHGRWPVLVTPEPGVGSRHMRLRRILVGVDGSAASERALDTATELATAFGSRVTIVRALQEDDGPPREPRVDTHLPQLTRRLSEQGVAVQTLVRKGDPADVVHEAADSLDPDLLAVGTAGVPWATDHGQAETVSRGLVQSTHRPTLVVPPAAPGTASARDLPAGGWSLPAGR
jgi:nucleotide-binding universal stress UspA family protein